MTFRKLFEGENVEVNEGAQDVANIIKGKSLFDMDKPLKKAGYKTDFMGMGFLKATKKGESFLIASEKNAEAGKGDVVQDGYVIGKSRK